MVAIVLVHPEIPPNTGNVIRLAANTGARLHLVGPLGFSMDHRQLRRAGLDYHDLANVTVHRAWKEFLKEMAERRMFAFTTKAKRIYAEVLYSAGDVLVFGPETSGLPESILEEFKPDKPTIPLTTSKDNSTVTWAGTGSVYFSAIVLPEPVKGGSGKVDYIAAVTGEGTNLDKEPDDRATEDDVGINVHEVRP